MSAVRKRALRCCLFACCLFGVTLGSAVADNLAGQEQSVDPSLLPKAEKRTPEALPKVGARELPALRTLPDEGGYWVYKNSLGRFDLSGATGACKYRWLDGKDYVRGLELVKHTALRDTVEGIVYFGWVYRMHDEKGPRDAYVFFSYTPVRGRQDGSNPVYPLYLSTKGPEKGFQRVLTNAGTIGIQKLIEAPVPAAPPSPPDKL